MFAILMAVGCRQGCLRSARPLRGGRRCVEDVSFWLKVQERNMQKLAAAGCRGRRGRWLSWPLAVAAAGCHGRWLRPERWKLQQLREQLRQQLRHSIGNMNICGRSRLRDRLRVEPFV